MLYKISSGRKKKHSYALKCENHRTLTDISCLNLPYNILTSVFHHRHLPSVFQPLVEQLQYREPITSILISLYQGALPNTEPKFVKLNVPLCVVFHMTHFRFLKSLTPS